MRNKDAYSSKQALLDFLLQHPKLFINMVSRNFPFDEQTVAKYTTVLDWYGLSVNARPWSVSFIRQNADRWDWKSLSMNQRIPVTHALLEEFAGRFDAPRIACNDGIHIDDELFIKLLHNGEFASSYCEKAWNIAEVKRFLDRIDDEDARTVLLNSIASIADQHTLVEVIENYGECLDWEEISSMAAFDNSFEMLTRFKGKWNWRELSRNTRIRWSVEIIDSFFEYWDWFYLSCNQRLPWSADFIEEYKGFLRWGREGEVDSQRGSIDAVFSNGLSGNEGLPFTIDLIERYRNNWDWKALTSNEALPWTYELVKAYESYWDHYWISLRKPPTLPNVLADFPHLWDWKALSRNTQLIITPEFLRTYKSKLEWKGLSRNRAFPCKIEIIRVFAPEIDFNQLGFNDNMEWTENVILEFGDRFDFELLCTRYKHKPIQDFLWDRVYSQILTAYYLEKTMTEITTGNTGRTLNW